MRKLQLLLGIVLLLPVSPPSVAAASVTTAEVAAAAASRAEFGLNADIAFVRELIGSPRDVGTQRWGIPMTGEEEAEVDFAGRMKFSNNVDRLVMPFLRSLQTFGGAYIDQAQGGGLVVLLTDPSADVELKLAALLPGGRPGLRIVEVAHTEAALLEALARVGSTWRSTAPNVKLLAAELDTKANRIVLTVSPEHLDGAAGPARRVQRDLGVPLALVAGDPEVDVDCPNRDHCHDPSLRPTPMIIRRSLSAHSIPQLVDLPDSTPASTTGMPASFGSVPRLKSHFGSASVILAILGGCAAPSTPTLTPPTPIQSPATTLAPNESSTNGPVESGTLPPSGRWELLVTTPLDGATSNLTFLDFTGDVEDVAGTRDAIVGHGSNALRVAVSPRDPTVLLVRWGAASCNKTPTIALQPLTAELLLASLDPGPGRVGCDAASIDFGIKVQLAAPVAIGSIVATDGGLEAQSWGALLVGDTGGTRGVTVDDLTALLVGVRPIDGNGEPPGPNGISVSGQLDPRVLEVVWSADACPVDMRIDVANRPGGGLDLRIVVPRGGDEPCTDRSVTYGLGLQFEVPVVASDVTGSPED